MFKYFVSYAHQHGYGRCEITRETLIQGIEDIDGIEKAIAESNGASMITVLNYQLFTESNKD